jgi:acetolactate synthase I/II/III large subunit
MLDITKNSTQTGADLVVRALEAQGVTHVFGVPGAKIDAVFDALVDSKIKTVVCRHEQNAAFIAGGIGRMTGRAGVAIATSGPGVSNLTTGLATANSEGDPVVALGGAVATDEALKQIHQTMDAVSILKPVTKYSVTVGAPDQVSEVMAKTPSAPPRAVDPAPRTSIYPRTLWRRHARMIRCSCRLSPASGPPTMPQSKKPLA